MGIIVSQSTIDLIPYRDRNKFRNHNLFPLDDTRSNMGSNDMILLRNVGIASAVVIAVIALFSIVGNTDGNPCHQAVQEYQEHMEPLCSAEYLEWGYDTVEQCMNDEMGSMPDPEACM